MSGGIQADRLARALSGFGASPAEVDELLRYNENVFDLAGLAPGTTLPLPDEPFVAFWEQLASEARQRGAFAVLRENLPQLRFPVRAGISQTEGYQAATRRGVPPAELPEATGLELPRPELVELEVHPSPAGRIPVLVARGRAEFVALLRALSRRNEPAPVSDCQGALMISGYVNWSRVQALRRRWESLPPAARGTATWGDEMARIAPRRELYQDRLILLSDGPYSGVPAAEMGVVEDEWRRLSLAIRRDHECAHYLTRRLFGSMRNNLLDELIADYAGLVAAIGRFRADWFLRFMGLEAFPAYRPGSRLEVYRGEPPLSDGAFRVLQALVAAAAATLESFDRRRAPGERSLEETALVIAALASLRFEDIASPEGEDLLAGAVERAREAMAPGEAASLRPAV